MKGRTILITIAALIITGVIVAAALPKNAPYSPTEQRTTTQTPTNLPSGNVQEVTLSLKSGNYVVTPSTLKAGVPVKMTVDLNTVTGCTKDIVIPSMNVRKRVNPGDNVITFTPLQTGTITMSCSMGMVRGSFEVVTDAEKTFATAPQEQALPSNTAGHTCSSSGGGCGCGMH